MVYLAGDQNRQKSEISRLFTTFHFTYSHNQTTKLKIWIYWSYYQNLGCWSEVFIKILSKQYLLQGFDLKIVKKSGLHVYFSPSSAPIHTFQTSFESYRQADPFYAFKCGGKAIFVEELSGTSAWFIYVSIFWSKNRYKKVKYIHYYLSASIP